MQKSFKNYHANYFLIMKLKYQFVVVCKKSYGVIEACNLKVICYCNLLQVINYFQPLGVVLDKYLQIV